MLRVEDLTKSYTLGDRTLVKGIRGVSFDVRPSEFYTLLGPSGCGKTTTLRSVAGLEEPTSGLINIGGRDVFDSRRGVYVPANRRNIGMVFQSYAVWPHMTVFNNAAFPLRMSRTRRYAEAEIRTRVERTLETTGLAAFAGRSAAQLSGGQQQRLSLARALVAEPRLLLLDEPLSNLDAMLREQMRSELRRLQKEIGVTAVYVTHDQSEALALSDRIAVMRDGAIIQIGTPKDIYFAPTSEFVATFIGRSNLMHGEIARNVGAQDVAIAQTPLGLIECRIPAQGKAGQKIRLVIRPEHVVLHSSNRINAPELPLNHFRGRVVNVVFLGELTEMLVQVSEEFCVLVRSMAIHEFAGSEDVILFFPPERTIGVVTTDLLETN